MLIMELLFFSDDNITDSFKFKSQVKLEMMEQKMLK